VWHVVSAELLLWKTTTASLLLAFLSVQTDIRRGAHLSIGGIC